LNKTGEVFATTSHGDLFTIVVRCSDSYNEFQQVTQGLYFRIVYGKTWNNYQSGSIIIGKFPSREPDVYIYLIYTHTIFLHHFEAFSLNECTCFCCDGNRHVVYILYVKRVFQIGEIKFNQKIIFSVIDDGDMYQFSVSVVNRDDEFESAFLRVAGFSDCFDGCGYIDINNRANRQKKRQSILQNLQITLKNYKTI